MPLAPVPKTPRHQGRQSERNQAVNHLVGQALSPGLLEPRLQIGQTGVEVSPTLLMACGISGASEFTIGTEDSKLVIAINTDRRARIFKFADMVIIGDIRRIIPFLIQQIERYREDREERGDSSI